MNVNNINDGLNEAQVAILKQTLGPQFDVFTSFQNNQAEFEAYKVKQRVEGRKKDAGQDFFSRRQTIAMRRIDIEKYAPDDDVLAYVDIHKLKKIKHETDGTYEEKMKIPVSDDEIAAFRALENDGHYFNDITLNMVDEKVAAAKGIDPAEANL